jgi:hypothetical protein
VGEQGPELVILPQGSQVIPMPMGSSAASSRVGVAEIHLHLNGREFAEAIVPDLMAPMVKHIRLGTGLMI